MRSAVLAAIHAVLTAYPFDGIFLDNYDVQNAMLLDTQGNQYLGTPGQVWDPADYAAKLAAMTSLAKMIRDAWPDALIVANGDNVFPSFNGELVEGDTQISRVRAQAAPIAGRVSRSCHCLWIYRFRAPLIPGSSQTWRGCKLSGHGTGPRSTTCSSPGRRPLAPTTLGILGIVEWGEGDLFNSCVSANY